MLDNRYAVAYSEILEILKYIPIEYYNKIPESKIELFKAYADDNYVFNYDMNKTLEQQNVSNITKGIIILLYRDYWATETQRNKIVAKQNYDRMKLEEAKRGKYNVDVFQNKDNGKDNDKIIEDTKNVSMVEYKESFFRKFIKKFKSILYK